MEYKSKQRIPKRGNTATSTSGSLHPVPILPNPQPTQEEIQGVLGKMYLTSQNFIKRIKSSNFVLEFSKVDSEWFQPVYSTRSVFPGCGCDFRGKENGLSKREGLLSPGLLSGDTFHCSDFNSNIRKRLHRSYSMKDDTWTDITSTQ